jgi:hypothetical protein
MQSYTTRLLPIDSLRAGNFLTITLKLVATVRTAPETFEHSPSTLNQRIAPDSHYSYNKINSNSSVKFEVKTNRLQTGVTPTSEMATTEIFSLFQTWGHIHQSYPLAESKIINDENLMKSYAN